MDEEKKIVDLTERLVVGTAMIEGNSEIKSLNCIQQLTGMAQGFSKDDICSEGIAGIHVCIARLKSLEYIEGNGRNESKKILEKIGKKLDKCTEGMELLKKMYSSNSLVDIYSDVEKIEKSFEKVCIFLVNMFKRYKLDIDQNVIEEQEKITKEELVKTLKAAEAAFEQIGGDDGMIDNAIENFGKQDRYLDVEYTTISTKIYNIFNVVLKGLWTYKYGIYFTGLSIFNIYNVVWLPGDFGLTLNTFFRILTAMCFTFANDIVRLNQMRRAIVDMFGNIFLKIVNFFLPFLYLFPDVSSVKNFLSFFIHLLFIGFTNWIQTISVTVCNMFGTSYALYEVGGLNQAFWEGITELGAIFTKYAVNTMEFLQTIVGMFTTNIMDMVGMALSKSTDWISDIWSSFADSTGSFLKKVFLMEIDPSQIKGEIINFQQLKESYPLAFTDPSGNLVSVDPEFKEKVISLMNNVVVTFQNRKLSPSQIAKNLADLGTLVLQDGDLSFKSKEEQTVALQAMRFAAVESLKGVVKQTLIDQAKNSYEKVKGVVENALEVSKMKHVIDWGTSQGPFKSTMIQMFVLLSCFSFLFTLFFDKKNSPFWGHFLDMFE